MPESRGKKLFEHEEAGWERALNVLILEDSPTDALLMQVELKRRWIELNFLVVETLEAFRQAITTRAWDIILSDYRLHGFNGLSALEILQENNKVIPFVLVSGHLDEETVIKAVHSGVRDYLRKDNLGRLVPLVERILLEKEYQSREMQIKERQNFLIELLELLNSNGDINKIYQEIVERIRDFGKFTAVGLRLRVRDHYPFKFTAGFTGKLCDITGSINLCAEKEIGHQEILLEKMLDCLCGKVLIGEESEKVTAELSSFWVNDQSELINRIKIYSIIDEKKECCLMEGYHSVAILPIRQDSQVIGLLHLNSIERGVFNNEIVEFYEKICNVIGIANNRSIIEQTIWEQGEMIRRVIKHSTNIFFILTPELEFSFVSDQVNKLLGYTIQELMLNWRDKLSDDPINQAGLVKMRLAKETGNHQEPFEMEFKHKNGNNILVEVLETPIVEEGKVIEIVGTFTDLSKLKRSELALLERDRQYHNLVNKAKVGIAVDDINGNIIYFNDTFAELYGYRRNEMDSAPFGNTIHPDDEEKVRKFHERHLRGDGKDDRYEMRGIRKDGAIIYLEVTIDIIKNSKGEVSGTRFYLWDITERKQNEILLRTVYNIAQATHETESTRELFEQIRLLLSKVMDTTNIFIAIYNSETDKLWIPLSADSEDDIEYHPAGKTLSKYVIRQGKATLLFEEDMDKLTEAGEIDLVGKPSKVWLGSPLKDQEEIIGLIVVQSYDNPDLYTKRDLEILEFVSDEIASALKRKRMDEELKKALTDLQEMHHNLEKKVQKTVNQLREKDAQLVQKSRQAAVGEMISRLAHNWRQPLNIISVNMQSIKDAWDFNELTDEYLEKKVEEAMMILEKLSRSIDDFRFFYQSAEEKHDFDVTQALKNVIEMNKSRFSNNDIKLILKTGDSFIIHGYQNELQQVLINILTNAFNVLIDRKVQKPKVWINERISDGELEISIRDNGGGIREDLVDIIFELYTSTKKELNNTGIGLYLSRLIIEKHMGGNISVINHPEGAEFIIKLRNK